MLQLKFFICLAVAFLSSEKVFAKTCNDCQLLTSCPGALYLAVNKKDSNTQAIITDALCSSEYENGIPKICCSDFPPSPQEINEHPNLSLLPTDCGDIEGSQIVGGEVAKLYEFTWMVLISYQTREGKKFLCGGTLINSRYVLTAAHCVKDATSRKIAGIRLGEYDWKTKVDCEKLTNVCESYIQDIAVEESIIHPSYRGQPVVRNDIALLRLKRPANLSRKNIGMICLPITQDLRERNLESEKATVAGWGLTENDTESSILLKVTIPISSSENCRHFYNRNSKEDSTRTVLCAGEFGKDSCKGDSGGPLMLEGEYNNNYKYIQHGIVSHGPSKCGSTFPGVYTNVAWYMKWILDNIKP